MIGWVLLGIVVVLVLYAIVVYNRLVRLRALVREGFSGITVQLRRRADLIPNLVETVKGYATHERETLDKITQARAAATAAGDVAATAKADAQMTSLLGRVVAIAEAYPELKADANFRELQEELSSIEGELAGSRRYYNATVRDLNTRVQSFPDVLFARPVRVQGRGKLRRRRSGDPVGAQGDVRSLAGCAGSRRSPSRSLRSPLHAEERIRDFNSDVRIAQDGTLTVVETIKVASEGLTRSSAASTATSRPAIATASGRRTRVAFDVQSVTRDGKPEPYTVSRAMATASASGSARPTCSSTTAITPTSSPIAPTASCVSTRISTNSTGTRPATAGPSRSTSPRRGSRCRSPAKIGQRAFYTGAQGSTETNAEVWDEGPGYIAFRTTQPLGRGGGADGRRRLSQRRGRLPPAARTQAGWWLQDWGPFAAGIIALAALLIYQVRAWWIAGRGPRAGTVVPLFCPPDDLSAAATRYISRMGMDNRAFTAAIVDSAVAGNIHIDKQDGGWFASDTTTLRRTAGQPQPKAEQRHARRACSPATAIRSS